MAPYTQVLASYGHVRDLPPRDGSVRPEPLDPPPPASSEDPSPAKRKRSSAASATTALAVQQSAPSQSPASYRWGLRFVRNLQQPHDAMDISPGERHCVMLHLGQYAYPLH